jgi:hypothetical protein
MGFAPPPRGGFALVVDVSSLLCVNRGGEIPRLPSAGEKGSELLQAVSNQPSATILLLRADCSVPEAQCLCNPL